MSLLYFSVRDHGTLDDTSCTKCCGSFIMSCIHSRNPHLDSSHDKHHPKHVSRSPTIKIMSTILQHIIILTYLICVVCAISDTVPEDGFIRGLCPRAEDIHPCMCLLLPKHLDSNEGEEESEDELVRETREAKLELFENESLPPTTPIPPSTSSDLESIETETRTPETILEDEVSDIELASDQMINPSSSAQLRQTSPESSPPTTLDGTSSAPRAIYMPPLLPPSSTLPASTSLPSSIASTSTIVPPTSAMESNHETSSLPTSPFSYSIPPTTTTTTTPIPSTMIDLPALPSTILTTNFSAATHSSTDTPNFVPSTIPIAAHNLSQPSTTLPPALNVSESTTVTVQPTTTTSSTSTSSSSTLPVSSGTTASNPTALELKSAEVGTSSKKEVTDHWSLWETMLICRNINSAKVFLDAVKSAKGYHFNFVIIDSVKLPSPFPFSVFRFLSFDFFEMLNISSLQFRNNFKDNRKEYFYGRTFKASQVVRGYP